MDRRELFYGMGALALGTAVAAAQEQHENHEHHEHHNHTGAPNQALINAAAACSSAAEACVTHCIGMLAAGDATLEACAISSRQTAVICAGLRSLAAQKAPMLAAYAKLAAEACKTCQAECAKHSQHETCKACAEACAACAAECAKLA